MDIKFKEEEEKIKIIEKQKTKDPFENLKNMFGFLTKVDEGLKIMDRITPDEDVEQFIITEQNMEFILNFFEYALSLSAQVYLNSGGGEKEYKSLYKGQEPSVQCLALLYEFDSYNYKFKEIKELKIIICLLNYKPQKADIILQTRRFQSHHKNFTGLPELVSNVLKTNDRDYIFSEEQIENFTTRIRNAQRYCRKLEFTPLF